MVPAGFQEMKEDQDPAPGEIGQPPLESALVASPDDEPAPGTSITLSELESTILRTNPALQEQDARILALVGKQRQACLPPNPTAGFTSTDINESGGAGWYGFYYGQRVVRGNKLQLSASVVDAELATAERERETIRQRLLTDTRLGFYQVLVAQEQNRVAGELVGISQDAFEVSQQLMQAREVARTDVLQSQLELQNARVAQRRAKNNLAIARRNLAALLGEDALPWETLDGDVQALIEVDPLETVYDQLVNGSPEILALLADVERARRQRVRECAEPIPDVTWQATLQYDFIGDMPVAGFQVGMPIPIRNRNEGAIQQAEMEIVAAERRVDKKALELRQRLAAAYGEYLDARIQLDAFTSEILPTAKETLDLIRAGYRNGEIEFLQLLTTQRTYTQTSLNYLSQLKASWEARLRLTGLLLDGALTDGATP